MIAVDKFMDMTEWKEKGLLNREEFAFKMLTQNKTRIDTQMVFCDFGVPEMDKIDTTYLNR